jgi:DNA segregation ATPase FtsK/SpoIIIE, S-DNA-T family
MSEPTIPTPPEPKKTDRDLQRGALRELITLSSESATTESEIEREHRTSIEQANRAFGDRNFEVDERTKRLAAEANQKDQARTAEIAAQYKAEKNQIVGGDRSLRQKLEQEKGSVDDKAKGKYQEKVWLADSVLELTTGQIAAAYKGAVDQNEASNQSLNDIEISAANLLQKYGLPLPTDSVDPGEDPSIAVDADAAFAKHKGDVEHSLATMQHMPLANMFVGLRPYVLVILIVGLVAVGVQFAKGTTDPQWQPLGMFAGGTLVLLIVGAFLLRMVAHSKVKAVHVPMRKSLALARLAVEQQLDNATKKRDLDQAAAIEARKKEVQAAKDLVAPHMAKAAKSRDAGLANAQAELGKQIARIDAVRDQALAEAAEQLRRLQHDIEHRKERDRKDNKIKLDARLAEIEQRYQQRRADLEKSWSEGLRHIQSPLDLEGEGHSASMDWNDPAWKNWIPPKKFASRVRFGEMHVDLKNITENVPQRLTLPPTFSLPAMLAFPAAASLLINSDHAGRMDAIAVLQMMMARLLTSLPAGRVRFTIIDPVGLGQNFAGFMHLVDYDDALVNSKIWTSQEQIDQRLANLTEHMETVIQKYLRNEFETIDDYNAQAGELAEPYRFLVIADLPVNFSTEAFRRLTSIAASGARCGVYTLIARDTRSPLPAGAHMDELIAHSVVLNREGDKFVWADEVFRQLPLQLDPPPGDDALTEILHKVGVGAKEAKRVEVPFEVIAPTEDKRWSGSTTREIDVPVGRMGATRFQSLKLGKGTSQHVLIAGKTGSGKSTLMHAMITNAALWYSPDEVELYLVDFKKGVEFKTYATNLLPHARAIAVESDREFGLSLLTRLDVELARRGELFRKAGVQDLIGYRATPNHEVVPRTLLIIDEFQEFFTEDDKLAQEAALLIERLVRQGRAFGMHVLLGSQTIGGAGGLPRGVLGQFAVRIALQTTEADSQMILGDNNSAARLLSRPGEAIYNDAGGLVEGNSPFQVAYLTDAKRDAYLKDLASKAKPYFQRFGYPIVFEGNAAADIRRNAKLMEVLDAPSWPRSTATFAPLGWLGDPVAIKDPTAVVFRRQAGANVLIVGQADEQSMAIMNSIITSVAVQQSPENAKFYVFDGSAADSPFAGTFEKTKAALPHDLTMVDFRQTAEAIDEVSQELARRQEGEGTGPSIYVIIYGLQRYRALRKSEEDFGSFSSSTDDAPKKPKTDKQLAELLREGPNNGIHIIAWCDTAVSLDRTFDRGIMREFDNRILFQMSASDSSNLIDSPSANKLGQNRALVYSEEQGTMERFRPYALPDTPWLQHVKSKLFSRVGSPGAVATPA